MVLQHTRVVRSFAVTIGFALLAGVAHAQASRAAAVPDSNIVNDKTITAGRTVFRGHGGCVVCHGQNLEGIVGPTLKAHHWKDAENGDYAAIIRVVSKGVPGTVMVSHPNGVTDEQIVQVAVYIWAVNHGRAKP
jgi:mono/diheme cytochrome c family protein